MGGVGQHSHLGVHAEHTGALGHLLGDLHQILLAGVDVDGAVAHGQHLVAAGGQGPHQNEAGGHDLVSRLGLHQLEGGTHGVGGGVGRAAQQAVRLAHGHQHGAEVVGLLQGLPALLRGHLALPKLHHLLHHLVHTLVGGGVQHLDVLHVQALPLGGGQDLLPVAHQDGGEEGAGQQAGGRLQNAGVAALGEHNGFGVVLQLLNQLSEHIGYLPVRIYDYGKKTAMEILYHPSPGFARGDEEFHRISRGKMARQSLQTAGGSVIL